MVRAIHSGTAKRGPSAAVEMVRRLGPVTPAAELAGQLNAAGLRGITVGHVTIYRVQHFTRELIAAAHPCSHVQGDRWFADETCVKLADNWVYLYRAVDQRGHVIVMDVLLPERRDLAAARRFFGRALQAGCSEVLFVAAI